MLKRVLVGLLCIIMAFIVTGCTLLKNKKAVINNHIVFSNLFSNDPEVFGEVYFNTSYVLGGTEVKLILLANEGYDYMQGTLRYFIGQEPGLTAYYVSDSNVTIGQPFTFIVPEITHESINSSKDKWSEPIAIRFVFNLIEL